MEFSEEYNSEVSNYIDAKHDWLNAIDDYNNKKIGKKVYGMKKMAFNSHASRFAEASLNFYVEYHEGMEVTFP